MIRSPEFFVALRMLRGRKSPETGGRKHGRVSGGMGGAILGIAMSLVPLVLVMTVSDGMIQGITNRYIETSSYHIQAVFPSGMDSGALAGAVKLIEGMQGVKAVFAEVQGAGVAAARGGTRGAVIRGVDASFFSDKGSSAYLEFGPDSTVPSRDNEILLGTALAEALGVKKGGVITLMTQASGGAEDRGIGAGTTAAAPQLAVFRVCGTVSAGYRDLDSLWAFVTPAAARRILAPEASRTMLGVKTADAYSPDLESLRGDLAATISAAYPDWFESSYVQTWKEAERSLFRSFSSTKTLLSVIMALAVIVAAVNLSSALGVFVAERRTEIAVMRSFGISDKTVRAIFVAAGATTGLAGSVAGVALGSVAAWRVNDIITGIEWLANAVTGLIAALGGGKAPSIRLLDPSYYLERIPVDLDPLQIAAVGAAGLLLCLIASILPARRAGAMIPMELLRKT